MPSDVETLVKEIEAILFDYRGVMEEAHVVTLRKAITALSSAPVYARVEGLAAAVIDLAETHPKLDVTQRRGLKIVAQTLLNLSRQLTTERQAWEKVRAEIEALFENRKRVDDVFGGHAVKMALAILAQYAPKEG